MKHISNAMKFGNQSRSSSLIINVIFGIADLDPKFKNWADLVSKLQYARLEIIQLAIACSKLTIETLEQGMKYIQKGNMYNKDTRTTADLRSL